MTKKPRSPDPVKPEEEKNGARSRTSSEVVAQLTETVSTGKNQRYLEGAKKLVEEHIASKVPSAPNEKETMDGTKPELQTDQPSHDSIEEIDEAATTLTDAVDQMVPSLLLSLGMLDSAIKWLKFVATLMGIAIIMLAVLLMKGVNAASLNKTAAEEVGAARAELVEIRGDLIKIKGAIIDVQKSDARRQITEATEPKIVAGDKPGEVALVAPKVDPKEIEQAKKKAEEAVERGEDPPKPPTPKGTTKIPVTLGEGKKD